MSKVYFTDLHATPEVSLLTKLRRLVIKAGLTGIDMKDKFAAIKIHFGEYGNLAYLRPNYAKVIADIVKENGGKPFLTDCNTLYPGGRKNALDHIDTAYLNGFFAVFNRLPRYNRRRHTRGGRCGGSGRGRRIRQIREDRPRDYGRGRVHKHEPF